jgi:outer membrane protein OmpA-like peptidoglycan-associated protein
MKRLFIVPLFVLSGCLTSQESHFIVSGTIKDCRTNEPIRDITVVLTGNDKSQIKTQSDSSGYYYFTNCFTPLTNYNLTTEVKSDAGKGTGIKYGICEDKFYEKNGYSNSYDSYKFIYSDTLKKHNYDFCLVPIIADYYFPSFHFKKNSTDFDSVNWGRNFNSDTIIDCFVSFLMAHKTWTIEISGHSSSDETNKKELAEKRAKKMVGLLITKGIDKERLLNRSYSDSRPAGYMTFDGIWIEYDKNNEKNRRIQISVLSKDYDPIKKGFNNENEE